jgi:hypothetical protein
VQALGTTLEGLSRPVSVLLLNATLLSRSRIGSTTQVLSTARNAIRRVRMVMRGLPQRELTEEGKRLIGSIQHEATQDTKQARLRCVACSTAQAGGAQQHPPCTACTAYCLPVHSKGCSCTAALVRWGHVLLSNRLLHGSGVHIADWCCLLLYCSEDRGPTRNLLTSQFLTPAELRQMLQHCYRRADRQGLILAAMLALGVYNGFRWALHAFSGWPGSMPCSSPSADLSCVLQGGCHVAVYLWPAGLQQL